jgi:hypothetical protein
MRGIVIYFLFVFSLLLKDGVSLAVDTFSSKEEFTISYDMSLGDTMKEEVKKNDIFTDYFELCLLPIDYLDFKLNNPNSFVLIIGLNVHLEQLSPPPRLA